MTNAYINNKQIETLSDRIDALRTEAGQHRDWALLNAITIAIGGTDRPRVQVQAARRAVVKALRAAEAQAAD